MASFESLRRRSDFARVRGRGRRTQTPRLAVYSLRRREGPPRVGLVVGRAVGGAVERNRLRRRLRAALRELPWEGYRDLVVVARAESASAAYRDLVADLRSLL